jgi:hypothetical protein
MRKIALLEPVPRAELERMLTPSRLRAPIEWQGEVQHDSRGI